MKPEAPTVVGVRAIDVGYFSTKYTLGRRMAGASAVIGTSLFPSLVPILSGELPPQTALQRPSDAAFVDINGVTYVAGNEAETFSSGQEPRPVLANYCMTDQYLALVRGALHYMAREAGSPTEMVIRNLVLGLPINTLGKNAQPLQERITGEHLIPVSIGKEEKRRVTVERVTVIAQPQGALAHYGLKNHAVFQDARSLVIDAGGGTLDWYMTKGRVPNWQRSGAYPKSMLACAYAVAHRINPDWKNSYEIIERIDKALRTRATSFTTGGTTYDLAQHMASVEGVLKESIDQMEATVKQMGSLDVILFTGGGAPLFYDYMVRRYPSQAQIMHMDTDPIFSNVKGFHLIGEIVAGAATA